MIDMICAGVAEPYFTGVPSRPGHSRSTLIELSIRESQGNVYLSRYLFTAPPSSPARKVQPKHSQHAVSCGEPRGVYLHIYMRYQKRRDRQRSGANGRERHGRRNCGGRMCEDTEPCARDALHRLLVGGTGEEVDGGPDCGGDGGRY